MEASGLITLGLMVVVFYFLLLRPQQKRLRQHQSLISSLEAGNEVVTIGGMYGVINRMDDTSVWLEIADGVVVRYSKQAISRKTGPEAEESEMEPEVPPGQDAGTS